MPIGFNAVTVGNEDASTTRRPPTPRFRSASFAADAARTLGYHDDAERWSALASRTKAAFLSHYVSDAGWVRSDCATVYALAITFGLLDGPQRELAGARLAELVRDAGYRVTTGFAGTPYVTWALSETGNLTEAYRLLLECGNPSWLYPVTRGATTVWERWDSILPDGSINTGAMTSFNHYALGAVVDWIYQVVGGIRPAIPGYGSVRVQPQPGPGFDWARTAYRTPRGVVTLSNTCLTMNALRRSRGFPTPSATADASVPQTARRNRRNMGLLLTKEPCRRAGDRPEQSQAAVLQPSFLLRDQLKDVASRGRIRAEGQGVYSRPIALLIGRRALAHPMRTVPR